MKFNHALTAALVLVMYIVTAEIEAGTRVSDYGSNPYMSYKLFPQNIMRWQGNFIYYYPDYMKSPWWGDIDEPGARPNATYTTTGSSEEDGETNYDHGASGYQLVNAQDPSSHDQRAIK